MTTGIIKLHALIFALLILTGCEVSSNYPVDGIEEYIDLAGEWKFSIGDDLQWSEQTYNDDDWDDILVPSSWENEGFHGYDGFAWYRKDFELPGDYNGRNLYLYLGYIDDADEVYINGNLVGSSGSFPPFFNTAYTAFRKYIVPGNILNKNKNNVVSVRVFDSQLSGGILSGEIGLFINKNELNPDLDLTGKWKFNTGDNSEWKEKNFNDSIWINLFVPSHWDNQGFRDYDGFAWYRKEFILSSNLENKKLLLLLGKIDDIDETYLNGTLIGSTGIMHDIEFDFQLGEEYLSSRSYYIPDSLLTTGKNIIAVRVYDGFKDGGIYQGPIGIIKQETYTKYWKNKKDSKGFFD